MVHETEKDLMKVGLGLISFSQLHPNQKFRLVAFCVYSLGRCLWGYLLILDIVRNFSDLNALTEGIDGLLVLIQAMGKLSPVILYRDETLFLLDINRFWKIPEKSPIKAIYQDITKLMRFYIAATFITLAIMVTFGFLTGTLPLNGAIPDIKNAFIVLWFTQSVLLIPDICLVVGMDMLFIALCVNIIAQFTLLNDELKLIKGNNFRYVRSRLNRCIRHHAYLLSYVETLINTFKIVLLWQFIITTYSACMQFYLISQSGETIFSLIYRVIYMSALGIQLGIYCFSADYITDISLETSLAVYSSEWYSLPVAMQKTMLLVMMRAQKPLLFTAGGLITINKMAFTQIFKTSMSFCTMMKNVETQNGD